MTKVYCVMRNGGEWEDSYSYVDRAFFDEAKAIGYKDSKNRWLKKQREIENGKINKFNETDTDDMTDEEYRAFNQECEVDYFILEQHNYTIDAIEVE